MIPFIRACTLVLVVSACAPMATQGIDAPEPESAPADVRLMQGMGETRHHRLDSGLLDRPFHLFVRLPEEYAEQPGTRYAVIYLLDGGNTFPLLAAHHHYLRLGRETPPAIIVGIGYGAETYRGGNMRQTDFTAPSTERDFWGGAGVFQQVIEQEIFPLVERSYRADGERRILFGQSLGGQFVLYNALTRPDLFIGHIASNPAFHRNLPFFLEWRGKDNAGDPPSRLFVSMGADEQEQFRGPASQWMSHWSGRDPLPWALETRILPGQSHFSAAPLAFRQGLAWILGQP